MEDMKCQCSWQLYCICFLLSGSIKKAPESPQFLALKVELERSYSGAAGPLCQKEPAQVVQAYD